LYSYGQFNDQGFAISAGSGIVKWTGTQWIEFAPGLESGTYNQGVRVTALSAFDDGTGVALWAAGYFHTPDTQADYQIARWDGSSWSAFPVVFDVYTYSFVEDIGYSNGSLIVAGSIFCQDTNTRQAAARWNGTAWESTGLELGALYGSPDLHEHNGTLYLATGFQVVDQSTHLVIPTLVFAWTGSGWAPLGSIAPGYNSHVSLASYQGELYVAGGVSIPGQDGHYGVLRWDGTAWSGTGFPPPLGQYATVLSIGVYNDGSGPRLYATSYNGVPFTGWFLRSWNGGAWTDEADVHDGGVSYLASVPSGSARVLYAAGLTRLDGMPVNQMVRLVDGEWKAMGLGVYGGYASSFASLDLQDGRGKNLYVGLGNSYVPDTCFSAPGKVIRWDGLRGETVALTVGYGWEVWALAAAPHGLGPKLKARRLGGSGGMSERPLLFAGGYFAAVDDVAANAIAVWDGSSWSAVGPGLGSPLQCGRAYALRVVGGSLLAGVDFGSVGGVSCNGVACWNGRSWRAFGQGLEGNNRAYAFAEHDDGNGPAIYVAAERGVYRRTSAGWVELVGGETMYGSPTYPFRSLISYDDGNGRGLFVSGGEVGRVHCWRGGAWTVVGAPSNDFGLTGFRRSTMAVMDDGSGERLYLGGYFDVVGGVPASRLARWDGSLWEAVGNLAIIEPSNGIEAMTTLQLPNRQSPSLFLGGYFYKLGDVFSHSIGEWVGCQ
jgi:hypothetical protein